MRGGRDTSTSIRPSDVAEKQPHAAAELNAVVTSPVLFAAGLLLVLLSSRLGILKGTNSRLTRRSAAVTKACCRAACQSEFQCVKRARARACKVSSHLSHPSENFSKTVCHSAIPHCHPDLGGMESLIVYRVVLCVRACVCVRVRQPAWQPLTHIQLLMSQSASAAPLFIRNVGAESRHKAVEQLPSPSGSKGRHFFSSPPRNLY